MKTKVLFVHVPQFMRQMFTIGILPIGYFAMADCLDRNGVDCEIIHLGIEKIAKPHFDLAAYVAKEGVSLVCFSIHWHYQLYDVLGTIAALKRSLPEIKVVVGGYTASFFGAQLMRQFKKIDYLIRGEGELPLLLLVKKIGRSGSLDFSEIPNLAWRKGKEIVFNPVSYVATQNDLDELNFARCDLFKNYDIFVRLVETGYKYNSKCNLTKHTKTFMLCVGRGCGVNCFYCGGGARAQKIISNRKRYVFRSVNKVVGEMKQLLKFGINSFFMDYDPAPGSNYYVDLFKAVKKLKGSILGNFASWGLPNKRVIDSFEAAFSPNSIIIISPDTASESIRRRIKGFYFSNEALYKTLDYLALKGTIKTMVYFFAGSPYETKADVEKTYLMRDLLVEKYPFVTSMVYFPEIEPAADFYMNPERYEIDVKRKNFASFYNYSKTLSLSRKVGFCDIETRMGYRSKHLSPRQLDRLICQNKVKPGRLSRSAPRIKDGLRLRRADDCVAEEFFEAGEGLQLKTRYLLKNVRYGTRYEFDEIDCAVYDLFEQEASVAEARTKLRKLPIPSDLQDEILRTTLKKMLAQRLLEVV